jgi:hypothetical protein
VNFRRTSLLIVLAAGLSASARAGLIFSDLGTGSNVYSLGFGAPSGIGLGVDGSSALGAGGLSSIIAELFTASGTGNLPVTQIDLAILNANSSLNTFTASIWTINSGTPGVQLPNAFWQTSTPYNSGTCCGLVSIQNITGVTLTGGAQYFLVLAPVSLSDSSTNTWAYNSLGVNATYYDSTNGGASWIFGFGPATAFDILSTPEPATGCLIGFGLATLLASTYRGVRNPE